MNGDVSTAFAPFVPLTGSQEGGWDLSQSDSQTTSDQTTSTAAPTTLATREATAAPTALDQTQQTTSGVYTPSRPDYVQYNANAGFGVNDLTNLFKTVYSGARDAEAKAEHTNAYDTEPVHQYAPAPAASSVATTTTGRVAGDTATPPGDTVSDGYNKLNGYATTFGLSENTVLNSDGTVDTKYWDKGDNGWGAFGYNTRDPKLVGASLPVDVLKNSIGDYTKDLSIWRQIKNGDYKAAVTTADGKTRVMKIVDSGPANWTGNLVDLTWGAQNDLGLHGKDLVDVQLVGPDGSTVPIKGFHPSTLAKKAQPAVAVEPPQREAESEEPTEKPKETITKEEIPKKEEPKKPTESPKKVTSAITNIPGGGNLPPEQQQRFNKAIQQIQVNPDLSELEKQKAINDLYASLPGK
jgi:hypothetical protein